MMAPTLLFSGHVGLSHIMLGGVKNSRMRWMLLNAYQERGVSCEEVRVGGKGPSLHIFPSLFNNS